ncbi:hypothetical protein V5799_013043 [Amblyomma americanum]|uniref:Amidase domain-containing protein n=1 Tax=Amblyomma americanum TaxID=6943 RepID=A0AAQ4E6Z4_AMBAM
MSQSVNWSKQRRKVNRNTLKTRPCIVFSSLQISSVDVVSAYIRRIREVQPIINAVVEARFEEALEDAEGADRLVASGSMSVHQLKQEKPLLGLPFTNKNSIAVKGLRQDAGSLLWRGHRAAEDAPSVALLRAAGAIPLALTNVPELCMWDDATNLLDGCTLNPYDTRRSPGGSSGGEASLLAAAGSLLGLGTDLGGSVRVPAMYCGVFGHKPTSGVVPNGGLLPDLGEGMGEYNCVGPLTRFSEDLPLMLSVLAGRASDDLRLCEPVNLGSLKLYFIDADGSQYFSRVASDVREAVRKVTRHMKEAHGIEPKRLDLPGMRYGLVTWFKACVAKDPTPMSELFRPGGFNTFFELLRLLVGAGRHTLATLAACKMAPLFSFSSGEKAKAHLDSVEDLRDCFEKILGDNGVLVMPGATNTAPYHNQDLLMYDSPSMTALFNVLQVPATACPVMMSSNGLPLAVQVVARRGNDHLCLAVAREIEKRFGGWVDPGRNV